MQSLLAQAYLLSAFIDEESSFKHGWHFIELKIAAVETHIIVLVG